MSERPFCFVIVVWGEKFRNYLLDYCLPSLLAPGNIPALDGRRPVKCLFATTRADWELMRQTAIFGALEEHAEAVYVELPPHPPERPYWMQAIFGHKLCCDLIHAERAYRIFAAPDSIFADGSIARLHDLAVQGAEAVLRLTVPTTEEGRFFATMQEQGLLPATARSDARAPLIISTRQLASIAMQSMHRMASVNEWDRPDFCGYAAAPFWRVPGEEGMVCFGLNWDVFLIDYNAVERHDSSILDDRGFDGDYNLRTIGTMNKIYAIRDTDEIGVISWNALPYPPQLVAPKGGEIGKGAMFRASYYGPNFNALHRQMLFLPTRVHAASITEQWAKIERRALRTLLTWLDAPPSFVPLGSAMPAARATYEEINRLIGSIDVPWWRKNPLTSTLVLLVVLPAAQYANRFYQSLRPIPSRARALYQYGRLALRADRQALDWWQQKLRRVLRILGR